jgi:hypothetical protein
MPPPVASPSPVDPARDETVPSGKFVAPPLPTEREATWGLRFVRLFLLPFCAVGVGAACAAVSPALAGDWRRAGFFLVFAVVFGGAGFGLLAAIALGRRKLATTIERAHAHPDEPWLWREDWAARRVHDGARTGMWTGIFFAVMWNAIAIPVAVAVVPAAVAKGTRLALLGLVFPLAGVAIAVAAVRSALRYRRFGVSCLDLERVPIPVGHPLVGTVRAALDGPPAGGFRVVLSCIDRVTSGTGDSRTTTENVRWQEERRVDGTLVRDERGIGVTVPIAIPTAADAPGTNEAMPRNTIVWRLAISASVPGVDYAATFDVPVYLTAESRRPASSDELAEVERARMSDPPEPPSSISVTSDGDATTIVVPPFRNPGPTLSLAVFTLLWTGTIVLQRALGAPFIFPLVTGAIALLLWWAVLAMAFGSRRSVVRADGIAVTGRFLGIPRRRSIVAADVTGVEMPIQMQTGSTPYYSVLVRRRAVPGRTLAGAVTVATGIRDKREAERLVSTIARGLGLRSDASQS